MMSDAFIGGLGLAQRKRRKTAVPPNWHGFCDHSCIGGMAAGMVRKGNTAMQVFNNKLAAAAFSLAFSLVMFATAIAPANGGMLLPGTLA